MSWWVVPAQIGSMEYFSFQYRQFSVIATLLAQDTQVQSLGFVLGAESSWLIQEEGPVFWKMIVQIAQLGLRAFSFLLRWALRHKKVEESIGYSVRTSRRPVRGHRMAHRGRQRTT